MDVFFSCILYFAVYGVIGWVVESTYCSILFRRPVNRGFLNGPIIPVYAFGALIMIVFSMLLPSMAPAAWIAVVFVAGVVLTSCVEYFTGWLLETLFKSKWWDYSDMRFNIKGRICLLNSLCFGLMALIIVAVIHPRVAFVIGLMLPLARMWTAAAFLAVTLIDLILSVCSVIDLNRRLADIQKGLQAIKLKLDGLKFDMASGIRERTEQFRLSRDPEDQLAKAVGMMYERIKRLELDNRLLQRRLLRAFPNFSSLKYPAEHLNAIREQLDEFRHKKSGRKSDS